MNSIEEKLWNYIDGNCSADEQQAIARLIETDELYRRKHEELMTLNAEFTAMELDEPSMGFTFKVMEQVRAQEALKPLKSSVDSRIIKGIAAFFALTIGVILLFVFGKINWTAGHATETKLPEVKIPDTSHLITGNLLTGMLILSLVLGMYLFDAWLRRKNSAKMA